jgi:hypothetical protein
MVTLRRDSFHGPHQQATFFRKVQRGNAKGIAEIAQLAVAQPIAEGHTIDAALDALQRICVAKLKFKAPAFHLNLRFAIGAVIDISQSTAVSNLEAQAIQGLAKYAKEIRSILAT